MISFRQVHCIDRRTNMTWRRRANCRSRTPIIGDFLTHPTIPRIEIARLSKRHGRRAEFDQRKERTQSREASPWKEDHQALARFKRYGGFSIRGAISAGHAIADQRVLEVLATRHDPPRSRLIVLVFRPALLLLIEERAASPILKGFLDNRWLRIGSRLK